MSRHKIIRINAAELKCWDKLWEELGDHPLFQNANFDSYRNNDLMIASKQGYATIRCTYGEKECFSLSLKTPQ
jgi:hypothetical protein